MSEVGKIIRQKIIIRSDVTTNRDTIFVFGDNMERKGLGGQALAMRGEPNTIGIPTKWRPSTTSGSYFSDSDFPRVKPAIDKAFTEIEHWRSRGFDIVIPADGVGTGKAKLAITAPTIFAYLSDRIANLQAGDS